MEIVTVQGREVISPGVVNSFSGLQCPPNWRALEFLSGNLASFPICVQKDGVELETPHPLERILNRRANQYQTSRRMLKTWYYHGEHYSNGFAFIRFDPITNQVIGLYNLMPGDVIPYLLIPETGSIFDAEVWYWHQPSQKAFPSSSILHYCPQVSYDGILGYSTAQLFTATFERAQLLEAFQAKYLRKGTWVRGYVKVPAGTSKEQTAEIVAGVGKYRAETGDRDVPVLTGGAELVNTTITPVDSQLAQQDPIITKKISQIHGVDQMFLFEGSDAKYNPASVEAAAQNVVRFTFRPRIELLEAELTTKLLTEAEQDDGYTVCFDTSALIRGDTATEMQVATQGVINGLTTKNEGRGLIGLAPVADDKADQLLEPTHVASTPTDTPDASAEEQHSAAEPVDTYAAFRPLLEDAAQRVETKTAKAMETAAKKPEAERVIYCNVLAEQQAGYVADALAPVAATIKTVTGRAIDVEAVAERYGSEVRARAAGREAKPLATIMGEILNAA